MSRISQALRDWRQEHGRFVARETGTEYLRPICAYDRRTQRMPEKVAQSLGDMGRMPHPVAMEEARAHVQEMAARPDIDPDDDMRGAMLQRIARSGMFPDAMASEAAQESNEAKISPIAGHPIVQLGIVTLLATDPRKRREDEISSSSRLCM